MRRAQGAAATGVMVQPSTAQAAEAIEQVGIVDCIASSYSHGKMRYEPLNASIEDAHFKLLLDAQFHEALQPVLFAYAWGEAAWSPIPVSEMLCCSSDKAPPVRVQWYPLHSPPRGRDEVIAPFP